MLKLKYINSEISYEVDFCNISDHVIEIKGNIPIETEGFILSRLNFEDNWDYSLYTTIYKIIENGVQFSNDGSTYMEPDPIPEPITPDYKPYEPTPEEIELQFQNNKINKIELSKIMLADFLEKNPLHSYAHNNVKGIYSVTNEKQTLMMSQYMTYQIEKAINPDAKLTWNETGKACEEWTEEEFLQLILEIKTYVYPLVSYQQHLEEKIYNSTSQEELDKITINYNSININ